MKKTVACLWLFIVSCVASAQQRADSLVMSRLFSFSQNLTDTTRQLQTNVYVKQLYETHKRNFTLWCVPSMYAIARGQRDFVSEQYSRLTFTADTVSDRPLAERLTSDLKRQVYYTTIPHNRRTMPTVLDFLTPTLYDETLYDDHVLSPFSSHNRVFYRYSTYIIDNHLTRLYFHPRYINNTQLVYGKASVDTQTGRIIDAELNGEFDMLRFHTLVQQGEGGVQALIPRLCTTSIDFKFLGNHVSSDFEAVFHCPVTLPDSVNVRGSRQMIDSVRPISLSEREQAIYDRRLRRDTVQTPVDSSTIEAPRSRKHNYLKEIGWDLIGESLIRSLRASSDIGYVRLSPIINPQYISYSHRKGLSYRFKLGARMSFSDDVSLSMNTRFGYNFKQKQFYFRMPLRLNYSYRDRDAYGELVWANGNRIANSTVIDELKKKLGDIPEIDDMNLNMFDDQNIRVSNYLPLNNRLAVEAGIVFHQRKAVDKAQMAAMGMPTEYRSLAPMLSLKSRPWRKGPLITVDYERGLPGDGSNLTYERWEIDASLKHRLHRLQTLNLRVGSGFYTRRDGNFFMDYSNFRDENIPGGWDDDWSGNFQLLSSRMYNESRYYVRGNVSFESPLLAASFLPLVGRYVERERIYLSTLSIAHTRQYSEVGYGFTCRYFSVGAFASFLGAEFQETGAKFTFELFRRW